MKSKFLLLLAVAFAFAGCRGQNDDPTPEQPHEVIEGTIELIAERDIIVSNGIDKAKFYVVVTDASGVTHDVTEHADYYVSGQSEPLESNIFTSATPTEVEIYAIYGMAVSEKASVSAVDIAELPTDKGGLDFSHRVLLQQHTGTDCPNCPRVMTVLKQLAEDSDFTSRYCHVASHSYNKTDPAYCNAAVLLSGTFCSGYYPDITFNYNKSTYYTMEPNDLEGVKRRIKELQSDYAAASVAASVTYKDGKIYVNAEVKSVVDNEFRLALWVIEDDIYGKQQGATESWQNTHENALRKMYGKSAVAQIYGESIGRIKAGEKTQRVYAIDCESEWVPEKCEVVLLITSPRGDSYELENVASCPVGGSVEFAYK
jgi:hypothetical protein